MPTPSAQLIQLTQVSHALPLDPFALKALGLATALLFFKMLAIAIFQGSVRAKNDVYTNPEDAAFIGKSETAQAEHPDYLRLSKAYRNDLENIPIFLGLAWAFLHLHGSDAWAPAYFAVFTVARYGHSFFYLKAIQPWRALAFALGALVNVALAIQLVFCTFR